MFFSLIWLMFCYNIGLICDDIAVFVDSEGYLAGPLDPIFASKSVLSLITFAINYVINSGYDGCYAYIEAFTIRELHFSGFLVFCCNISCICVDIATLLILGVLTADPQTIFL